MYIYMSTSIIIERNTCIENPKIFPVGPPWHTNLLLMMTLHSLTSTSCDSGPPRPMSLNCGTGRINQVEKPVNHTPMFTLLHCTTCQSWRRFSYLKALDSLGVCHVDNGFAVVIAFKGDSHFNCNNEKQERRALIQDGSSRPYTYIRQRIRALQGGGGKKKNRGLSLSLPLSLSLSLSYHQRYPAELDRQCQRLPLLHCRLHRTLRKAILR